MGEAINLDGRLARTTVFLRSTLIEAFVDDDTTQASNTLNNC